MNIAAVWQMVVTFEWGRIWWGITHAHWANVWASISAIFTMLAVIVAGWALFRWKKQDELKVKLTFKIAVSDYAYCLMHLPLMLDNESVRVRHHEKVQKLVDLLSVCNIAWVSTEGLLEKDKIVSDSWNYIYENHKNYLAGKLDRDKLGVNCMGILSQKFVFK